MAIDNTSAVLPTDNNNLRCVLDSRRPLQVSLPQQALQKHHRALNSGRLYLKASQDLLVNNHIRVQNMKDVEILESSRQLRSTTDGASLRTGIKRVLAVHVTADQDVPKESIEEIRESIFGNPNNRSLPSVVSQYHAVSRGNLQLTPAVDRGVFALTLNQSLLGIRVEDELPRLLTEEAAKALSVDNVLDVADYVLFCLPSGSLLNGNAKWKAFGYMREPITYYQKGRCTKLSVVMHELGHSFGFTHSGDPATNPVYGDEQGYMGFSINKQYYPVKSFNAHKLYISGWMEDRKADVTDVVLSLGQTTGVVAAVVDADHRNKPTDDFVVVLKMGDLYLQYNRAKSYNRDTPVPDVVTIVQADSDDDVSLLAATNLTKGTSFTYDSFMDSTHSLVVTVCELRRVSGLDYAVISLHLDGIRTHQCKEWQGKSHEEKFESSWYNPHDEEEESHSPTPTPEANLHEKDTVDINTPVSSPTTVPTFDDEDMAVNLGSEPPRASPAATKRPTRQELPGDFEVEETNPEDGDDDDDESDTPRNPPITIATANDQDAAHFMFYIAALAVVIAIVCAATTTYCLYCKKRPAKHVSVNRRRRQEHQRDDSDSTTNGGDDLFALEANMKKPINKSKYVTPTKNKRGRKKSHTDSDMDPTETDITDRDDEDDLLFANMYHAAKYSSKPKSPPPSAFEDLDRKPAARNTAKPKDEISDSLRDLSGLL